MQQLTYYKWMLFGVVSVGTFMSTMTSSIVNVALPPITLALHTDIPTAQWVVTGYLLTITSLLPLVGRLGDVLGRRRMYGYGFIGFTLGSLLCGLADSIGMLIGFRIIQAISAALLMANGMAIVTANFPANERGRVLGAVGTIVALGGLSGPGLGGLLVEMFGWHAIFYVNIPIGLLGYAGVRLILPADRNLQQEKIDYLGAALFTAGMVSFLLPLSYGTKWGWLSWSTLGCLGIAGVMFMLFIWQEKSIDYPMLELSIFNNWEFSAGNLAGMLSFMAMFTNTLLLPYFLHDVLAFAPSKTGLIMSAFPVVMAVVAPLSGSLSDKIGTGLMATIGLIILALGLVWTAKLPLDAALGIIMASQATMGLGNGLFQSPNNNSVMSAVQPNQLGVASGVNALARNFGMVSGTAMAVSILEYRRSASLNGLSQPTPGQQIAAFMDGYMVALLVGAGLAVVGALISFHRSGTKR
ncbi:Riboflavin transporter RibZ [Sporomusa acidovorans DSM 3132]|uniref:Riboflavin transporter RibZ n=1 Tax=Sporomusa acidovorans (strain ATCC 49682 / DSM 3132 / Mol) TaxID=1123286 RepID=A0ABZ3J7H1_SPOA4|nr:multidrug resistance protein Stp [Sporomusa acidovorans DSM 3132]SDE67330.1 drug resistance transporter, EmrB/QacA subfamily [Sporomusa acidovorans]